MVMLERHALDGSAGRLLVLRHDVAHLFRVELLGERCRADEVAEEDGELAALALRDRRVLAAYWPALGGRRGLAQSGAARGTEACARAGVLAAARTRRHPG